MTAMAGFFLIFSVSFVGFAIASRMLVVSLRVASFFTFQEGSLEVREGYRINIPKGML